METCDASSGAFEGNVVRTIRMLVEVLQQLSAAAQAIGIPELTEKFDTCTESLKRGIVFAGSLYW